MSEERPRPVLKWAGGKSHLLREILSRLPSRIATYYEPFVGGGAVFFALAAERRFESAVLGDTNPDLLAVYRALQTNVEAVIELLRRYRHDEDEYYRVRAEQPQRLVERAARVIYLNRTGYNGLYRVNRSGQFNVPFGRYTNPTICDAERLRAAAEALRGVSLVQRDFAALCAQAQPGDAVYLDPPYLPVSATANFTAYDRHAFGLTEHQRLARCFDDLARRGVTAVLSNSDTCESRVLFGDHHVSTVHAPRHINSKAGKRGAVPEILAWTAAQSVRRGGRSASRPRARRQV